MVTRRFDGSTDVDGFLSRQFIGTSKLLSDAREHHAVTYLFGLCAVFSGLYATRPSHITFPVSMTTNSICIQRIREREVEQLLHTIYARINTSVGTIFALTGTVLYVLNGITQYSALALPVYKCPLAQHVRQCGCPRWDICAVFSGLHARRGDKASQRTDRWSEMDAFSCRWNKLVENCSCTSFCFGVQQSMKA